MKRISFLLLSLALNQSIAQTSRIDTLVDVGGYRLHFNILKGSGTPILFEAGGGEDATTWGDLIDKVSDATHATLITYDRAGFGKSTFDTTKHGILNGVKGLEIGLHKLGFDGNLMLVGHSQGGLYTVLYSSRHPDQVKGVVLIDATTSCFYNQKRLATTQRAINGHNDRSMKSNPGSYYQGADFSDNINYMRNITVPAMIPVVDLVAEYPPVDKAEIPDWKACHYQFASSSPTRKGITAYRCGHFIFKDDPQMVIDAIVSMYN